MRDGVRIAVDLWLPDDLKPGAKLPAIVHQTRYFRSVDWQRLLRLLKIEAFLAVTVSTPPHFQCSPALRRA